MTVMPSRVRPDRSPRRFNRVPNFDSGVIGEPLLAFGGRHEHVDPKTGLALDGPYSPVGQPRPTLTSIIVGIVGPAAMIADAEQWLRACRDVITNDGSQPFLFPHFPGFNQELPFQCELLYGEAWREVINQTTLQKALTETDSFDARVARVVRPLYRGDRGALHSATRALTSFCAAFHRKLSLSLHGTPRRSKRAYDQPGSAPVQKVQI